MTNINTEALQDIQNLPAKNLEIIKDQELCELFIDEINDSFIWSGSKIDWKKSKKHKKIDLIGNTMEEWVKEIHNFLLSTNYIKQAIEDCSKIAYVSDSILHFSVLISNSKDLFIFIDYLINNIPLHHYFFDLENKWCLVIACEGHVSFGYSPENIEELRKEENKNKKRK